MYIAKRPSCKRPACNKSDKLRCFVDNVEYKVEHEIVVSWRLYLHVDVFEREPSSETDEGTLVALMKSLGSNLTSAIDRSEKDGGMYILPERIAGIKHK